MVESAQTYLQFLQAMNLVSADYRRLLTESLALGDSLVTFITRDGSLTSSSTALTVLSPFFRDLVAFRLSGLDVIFLDIVGDQMLSNRAFVGCFPKYQGFH